MPKINLKQLTASGKSVVASARGKLESIAGAAGQGAFGVSVGKNGVSVSANFNELIEKKKQGNLVRSPLANLFNNPKIQDQLQFPSTLDNEHYIVFSVIETNRKNREVAPIKRVTRNIILPIPSNLSVSYGAEYENAELGVFGGAAAGQVDFAGAGGDIGNLISSKIKGAIAGTGSGREEIMAAGAAAAATAAAGAVGGGVGALLAGGAAGGGVAAGIGKREGIAINPHMAVMFKGVGFREHEFSYKFIARNMKESEQIKKIINTFKYHMHPDFFAGNLAFSYPDEFVINFADGIASNLYSIGDCVLKNFSVNYNSQGVPLFFEDTGAPVSIEITLQFQEMKIVTKSNMDNPNQTGVSSEGES